MDDGMNAIVDELRGLSKAKRRRILAQLSTAERRAVESMLRQRKEPEPAEPAPTRISFLDELSPQLKRQVAERLEDARGELTVASRQALRQALDALALPSTTRTDLTAHTGGPSLLALIGRNLARKRQRA